MKKKTLRILLFAALAFATLLALFYAWTDWAGARHWKAVEAALRAKGEPLTIAEIEPAPIPDEINFAAAPIFAEIARTPDSQAWRISQIPSFRGRADKNSSDLANVARSVDPKFAGTDAEAARLILDEAAKSQSILDEVREAGARPGANWKADYRDGFRLRMPQIQPLINLSRSLSAQAKARLELGNDVGALADVLLVIDLSNRVSPPVLLITHLVQQAMMGDAVSALKYGIERHVWSAPELERIQHALSSVSMVKGLIAALRVERAIVNDTLPKFTREDVTAGFQLSSGETSWQQKAVPLLWNYRPAGWNNEDRSAYSMAIQKLIDGLRDSSAPSAQRGELHTAPLPSIGQISILVLRTPFTRIALSGIENILKRTSFAQFQIDAARTACAIERYRLARGALPSTLDVLCPEFLSKTPPDLITGEPLHYQPGPGDSYTLYSVGWNEADDGGNDVNPKNSGRKNSPDSPDWVWRIDLRS
jgi:hypothetical protein